VKRRRVDTLWLRLGDVPAALAARRYAEGLALRLAVDGEAWDLVADGGGHARCTPAASAAAHAAGAPMLRVTRPALGSLYLGCASASQLARAGAVHGEPAAIATADRLFASAIAPWCPEVF
jgi:predicted acetyltransferase